jgi:putative ABC transport system permease protein
MNLAWSNLIHSRLRLAVGAGGVAFAVFLMLFQCSLLTGFLRAASRLVDSADCQLWIAGRGVACFDFPSRLPRRIADIAFGVEGVRGATPVCVGLARYRGGNGREQTVALIGADSAAGRDFPVPRWQSAATMRETLLIDESGARLLGATELPLTVEVNQLRCRVAAQTTSFGSFLGSPYAFTGFKDAHHILVRVDPAYDVEAVRQRLQARLKDADVWTREEFAHSSRVYWMSQTGAGGAILTAAALGFLVGLVIVSQTTFATTIEKAEEFATLRALGAGRGYIAGVVLVQAILQGLIGFGAGLAAALPATRAARASVAWIATPWWLAALLAPVVCLMCALASLASIRTALSIEPARVFRA